MFRLACLLVWLGTAAQAFSCGHPWAITLPGEQPIIRPGEDGYDPARYGGQLYERFERAIAAEDRMVVMGTVRRRDDLPFYHEVHMEQLRGFEQEPRVRQPDTTTLTYSGALIFDGYGIGDGHLVRIEDRPADLTIHVEGDYTVWALPEPGEVVMLSAGTTNGTQMTVEPYGCPFYLKAPPDEPALEVFLQCIADRGC